MAWRTWEPVIAKANIVRNALSGCEEKEDKNDNLYIKDMVWMPFYLESKYFLTG